MQTLYMQKLHTQKLYTQALPPEHNICVPAFLQLKKADFDRHH